MFKNEQQFINLGKFLIKMKESNVMESLVESRPSVILNLDNEHLSQKMSEKFNEIYGYRRGSSYNMRPDNYLLTNTVRHLVPEHEDIWTEGFYTLALKQINRRYYTFPSYYVGQYGCYEALNHLFKKGGLENLVRENSILISRFNSLFDIETARKNVADKFKEKHNIDKNATLVFFAPGNTEGENEYSLDSFRKGYNEFLYKYTSPGSLSRGAPSKDMFKLVVSVHSNTDSAIYVREYIKNNKFESQVIIVSDENNEHYDAMCASEFGFVYNGQMLSSAVSLHLNVQTMQDMNDLHYYWHTWDNRWLADINVNADRPIVPEFAAGEFWFGKIANKLAEMHTNTDLRWDQVRGVKPFISDMLPIKQVDRSIINERDMKYIDGDISVYDEFEDPIYIMSKKISDSISKYNVRQAIKPDLSVVKSIPSICLNNNLRANI